MKLLVVVALGATLGACATADDLRTKQPAFTGETSRPAPEYAGCVQMGWQDAGSDAVTYAPTAKGVTLTVRGIAGYELLLDNQSGSVTMFTRLPYGNGKFVEAARSCL